MLFVLPLLIMGGDAFWQPPSGAEIKAYDSIYYMALLSGRDPDAALRKAHFTAVSLVKQFGLTTSEAAAEMAKFLIRRSGRLCGG